MRFFFFLNLDWVSEVASEISFLFLSYIHVYTSYYVFNMYYLIQFVCFQNTHFSTSTSCIIEIVNS